MIQEDRLSDYQKVKKQLRETKSGGPEDVMAKLLEIKSKKFSSNFKSYSRDQWTSMYANRTNPPAVGHYRPKIEVILEKPRETRFNPHHINAEKAFKTKFDVAKSAVNINPRVLKSISPRKRPQDS